MALTSSSHIVNTRAVRTRQENSLPIKRSRIETGPRQIQTRGPMIWSQQRHDIRNTHNMNTFEIKERWHLNYQSHPVSEYEIKDDLNVQPLVLQGTWVYWQQGIQRCVMCCLPCVRLYKTTVYVKRITSVTIGIKNFEFEFDFVHICKINTGLQNPFLQFRIQCCNFSKLGNSFWLPYQEEEEKSSQKNVSV